MNKKRLAILLSTATIGVLGTTLPIALTSCSSQANPFFPSTSITANYNGTNYTFMFKNNVRGGFYLTETQADGTTKEITKDELQANVNKATPEGGLTVGSTVSPEYTQAIAKMNAYNAVALVLGYSNTLFDNISEILMRSPNVLTAASQVDVSQWNKHIATDNTMKEFSIAKLQVAGEGKQSYSIGPRTINMTINTTTNAVPGTQYESAKATTYNQDLTVSQYTINYGWFKNEYSGGTWLQDSDALNIVNKALTPDQKAIFKKIGLPELSTGGYGFTQTTFPINFAGITYNNFPEAITDAKDKSKTVFTGIYKISERYYNVPGADGKDELKSGGYCKAFGMNYEQTSAITSINSSKFLKEAIKNNHNYMLSNTWNLINYIGWCASQTATNQATDEWVKQYKTQFKANAYMSESTVATKLSDATYTTGITNIYKTITR